MPRSPEFPLYDSANVTSVPASLIAQRPFATLVGLLTPDPGPWMNRMELVGAVATHTGMEPREVDKALKGMTEVIEAVAAKGELAKFARVDRPARIARNPATARR